MNASGSVKTRHRILYVEDNPANRKLVQHLLQRRADLELITANTGEQGLQIARDIKPNLVLMDLQLPGMSGYEVLAALQQDDGLKHVVAIALSANAMLLTSSP